MIAFGVAGGQFIGRQFPGLYFMIVSGDYLTPLHTPSGETLLLDESLRKDLRDVIASYYYPPIIFDFQRDRAVRTGSMREMECFRDG